jgi:hypothetical protein
MWQGMLETAVLKEGGEAPLYAVAVWLRYSAMRQLTWNRNYNVKPREISAAQVGMLHLLLSGKVVNCSKPCILVCHRLSAIDLAIARARHVDDIVSLDNHCT